MKDSRDRNPSQRHKAAAHLQLGTPPAAGTLAQGRKESPATPSKACMGDTLMVAARGDDDLMSEPQNQGVPGPEEITGKWNEYVGNARTTWSKLTEDELLRSEGQEHRLAGLVQERYAITRNEANKRVRAFLAKHEH